MKVLLNFYFFLNLTLDLLLCQECQEGNRRSNVCILGTRSREMMNESKILRTVVVATTSFGGLDVNVYYGPFWKDST
jgi:hypothetical protein